jgi:adenylate kinase
MRKYIIMGAQGSGKGTQAKMLQEAFGLVHISVGDIFRWHIQSHTKLAARIQRTVAAGGLVPDETVEEVVKWRLDMHDWNYGFVLDGFPRNGPQALFFLESYDIDAVVLLRLSDEAALERSQSRRLCANCGLDYNLIYHRPAVEGVCDVCGGRLVARADDTPEVIRARLKDYRTKTEPILELFRRKELIVEVDAAQTPARVQEEIRKALGLEETPRAAPKAPS